MTWNSNNTNKKQLGTSHRLLMVIWLVQMLFLCVKFWPLQVIKKKKEIILLTLDWLWGHLQTDPTKACKRHKTDTFTKLGEPTIRAAWTPRKGAWPAFLMLFLLFLLVSIHLHHGLLYPQQKHAYSVLHPQALTKCSTLDFWKSSTICRPSLRKCV